MALERSIRQVYVGSCGLLVLGIGAVIAATVLPLDLLDGAPPAAAATPFDALDERRPELRPLLGKIASRQLIRPAQVRAAVMDRGLAKKLLARLKLQGVVQVGGGYTAYIKIDKGGVETVRPGSQILELSVEKVEPGRVTLSLEGVVVELTQ